MSLPIKYAEEGHLIEELPHVLGPLKVVAWEFDNGLELNCGSKESNPKNPWWVDDKDGDIIFQSETGSESLEFIKRYDAIRKAQK
jgi:hypothetical protein